MKQSWRTYSYDGGTEPLVRRMDYEALQRVHNMYVQRASFTMTRSAPMRWKIPHEDRQRFMVQRELYTAFLEQCAEFITHKLHDREDLHRARGFMDVMLRILDINTRGILIFNARGGISYLNDVARRELGELGLDLAPDSALPTDISVRRTGERFADLEEFVMRSRERKITLMGRLESLGTARWLPQTAGG